VSWSNCETCVGECPIYEGGCLLCGGTVWVWLFILSLTVFNVIWLRSV
jgi:hypothetical protein